MEEWTAVILAGGSGSRMGRGETKVVRPICGIPMVRLVSDIVLRAGIDETVVVVPPDHTALQTVMSDDRTSFAIQASRLGTGDALVSAMKSLDRSHKSHVLVLNADVPLCVPSTSARSTGAAAFFGAAFAFAAAAAWVFSALILDFSAPTAA